MAVLDVGGLDVRLDQRGAVRGGAVELDEQLVALLVVGREVEPGAADPEVGLLEGEAVVLVGVGEGRLGVAVEPEQGLAVRRLDEDAAPLRIDPRRPLVLLPLLQLLLDLGLDLGVDTGVNPGVVRRLLGRFLGQDGQAGE